MKFCVKLENKITEMYKMFKSALGGEKLIPTRLGHMVDLKILVENSEVLPDIRQH